METTSALVTVEKQVQSLQVQLKRLEMEKVSKLGDGQMFFLREGDKVKRAFVARVSLGCPVDFCYPMRKPDTRPMITGDGYDRINQVTNVGIYPATFVMTPEGKKEGSFWPVTDKNGSITGIYLHAVGIGYAPTGELVAIDKTIFIHLANILVQEIQSKLKKFPGLGMLGRADQKPDKVIFYQKSGEKDRWGKEVLSDDPIEKPMKGYWEFIPTTERIGYWINLSHPEMLAAWDSWTQKQRFIERSGQTILKRLILSSHPAIAKKVPDGVTDMVVDEKYGGGVKTAKGYVIVYGWRPESNTDMIEQRQEEMKDLAGKVAMGEKILNATTVTVVNAPTEDASIAEEIQDPIMGGADPSEIPEKDLEQEEDGLLSEPPKKTEGPPQPEGKKVFTLDMIFSSAGDKPLAAKIKAEMKLATYGDLKAKPELAAEFCKRYNERKGE